MRIWLIEKLLLTFVLCYGFFDNKKQQINLIY